MTIQDLQKGDPCPNCGGELVEVPAPSDAQRAAAADRETRQPLPTHVDTAPADVRAELGALHRCAGCRYAARFKTEEKASRRSRVRDEREAAAH